MGNAGPDTQFRPKDKDIHYSPSLEERVRVRVNTPWQA